MIVNKRNILFLLLIIFVQLISAQTHPGADPSGMSVPIDGGILMAILAGGGLFSMLLKKKKKDE